MNIPKVDKIIKECDVCISTLSKFFYSDNFPGKILRYMVNSKPVLVHSPNNSFLKNLIEKNFLGLYSSDEKNLYNNIDFIFSNFQLFQERGKNGFDVVKNNFSCEHAKKILFS
jgi:glycosyltransferase involved in cell wall biosynthesis